MARRSSLQAGKYKFKILMEDRKIGGVLKVIFRRIFIDERKIKLINEEKVL